MIGGLVNSGLRDGLLEIEPNMSLISSRAKIAPACHAAYDPLSSFMLLYSGRRHLTPDGSCPHSHTSFARSRNGAIDNAGEHLDR